MSSSQAEERIVKRINGVISKWKMAFAKAVQVKTGIVIAEPEKLSYAQILMERSGYNLTDALQTTSSNVSRLSGFDSKAIAFLTTPGYRFAKQCAQQIYDGNDSQEIERIAREGVPLIAMPHDPFQAPPLGVIFHSANGMKMLEMFYQAGDAPQTQLADGLYTGPFGVWLASIKAIPHLKDNPVLKKTIDELEIDV